MNIFFKGRVKYWISVDYIFNKRLIGIFRRLWNMMDGDKWIM